MRSEWVSGGMALVVRQISGQLALFAAALLAPSLLRAQGSFESVGGIVRADSTRPVVGARVVVLMAPDRITDSTLTDAEGRWQLSFANGTGDYLVRITRIGFKPFQRRARRSADSTSITLDATLERLGPAPQLERVLVIAQRPKPQPGVPFGRGDGGDADDMATGVLGGLTPSEAGNLDAIASTIPGIIQGANGPSALGLDASQNQTRLNGLSFGGGGVPRCAQVTSRVTTSSLDAGRGGFSGAQIDAELDPGFTFSSRIMKLAVDAPPSQLHDPVSRATGLAATNVQGCLAATGELAYERWFYSTALQVNRRVADVSDLFTVDRSLLGSAGVAADSASRLYGALRSAGIPVAGALAGTATTDVSFLGRVDRGQAWRGTSNGFLLAASVGEDRGLGLSTRDVGTVAAQRTRAFVMLQANATWRFRTDWLNEFKSSVSWSHQAAAPDLALPQGRVLVRSALADGTATATTIGFAGSPFANARSDALTWETLNETQRVSGPTGAHRLKLTAQIRVDALQSQVLDNAFGSFQYNSLADLAADRPANFSRQLFTPEARVGQFYGALALGDAWRITHSLRVQAGARVEVNSWLVRAADNPAVRTVFGVGTNEAPNRMHVSPRLGFEWRFGNLGGSGLGVSTFSKILFMNGGAIRGGVGEFRNTLATGMLTEIRQSTGLAAGAQRVACYGADVPARDWIGWGANPAAIPVQCASGSGLLVDAAPAVRLFSPDYQPERSWRGHLEWQQPLPAFMLTVRGTYSRNLNQPSGVDLNFSGTERFALADEGNRSVWVPVGSVTPATGAVSPVASRATPTFGPVWMRTSDLESESRQLLVSLAPSNFHRLYLRLDYALNDVQQQFRGFDGAGAGDPRAVEWARGVNDVRHVAQVQAGTGFGPVSFTVRGWAQSGRPFTPVIGGDVSGLGRGGERAFVFNPGSAVDTAVANSMTSLLRTAPLFAQRCLLTQLSRVAGRNSCEGPWTGGLTASFMVYGGDWLPGIGRRAQITLTAGNVLSGIDQLTNGSATLQGWGLAIPPDNVLLTVMGFDPSTRRFRYAVNQRFGSVSPLQSLVRAPMAITLDVHLDLGVPLGRQQVDRWLKPGRGGVLGPRLSSDSLLAKYRRNTPNPYAGILEASDSLLLTNTQVAKLEERRDKFRAGVNSAWRALTDEMAALPDDFDAKAIEKRQEAVTDEVWELARLDVREWLPQLLTPVQLTLLPWPADFLFKAEKPVKGIRIYYY